MSLFSALQTRALQGYTALQGAQGQPQSAADTISKLVDRLQHAQHQEDRRSSILGLKGMARDWKEDVGRLAMPSLLSLLCRPEITEDTDMAKAILETLHVLCEVQETETGKVVKGDTGLANVDVFLKSPDPSHALVFLLSLPSFYIRFFSLQLLGTLLSAPSPRPATLQSHLLSSPGGLSVILSILDDSREIIRNEALLLLISITSTNADIQKIVAFEGAFERLFRIVDVEGGIGGGGIVVQDCLSCVGALLRYNVSNQNYFRETSCIPHLAPMLLFPPNKDPPASALDAFSFQPWTSQKSTNASLVIALARTLVSGAGSGKAANQKAMLSGGLTRCLLELALASTAPWNLKSTALHALTDVVRGSKANQDLVGSLVLNPIGSTVAALPPSSPTIESTLHNPHDPAPPRPSTSSETFRPKDDTFRTGPQPAILALISLAVSGPPGHDDPEVDVRVKTQRDILRLRASAVHLLEAYVSSNPDGQLSIVATMSAAPPEPNPNATAGPDVSASQTLSRQASPVRPATKSHSAGSLLLSVLRTLPIGVPGVGFDSYSPFFACLIFAHLLRGNEQSKQIARKVSDSSTTANGTGAHDADADDDDDDERTGLVHTLVGNLMMSQRAQGQGSNAGEGQARALEWARVMIGYLVVLSVWMWESPKTTKEFLSEGTNLQVLIDPVAQTTGVDPVVQGLCAFVLGICYEYDREGDSSIPRSTLQPILTSRIGPDQFVNRILRLREDARFKNVGPDTMEMNEPPSEDGDVDDGLWFDWPFVEFLKNNYLGVQRAILLDPGSTESARPASDNGETAELLSNLRAQVSGQSKDIDALHKKLTEMAEEHEAERRAFSKEVKSLTEQLKTLSTEAETSAAAKKEAEKEQEDLLVLLEEVTSKRKRDKARMREKGMEVSEDEDDDDDEDA